MFTICLPASIGTFYDKSFLAGLCTTCNRLYKLANVLYDTREWLNPSLAISVFLLCFSLLLFLREKKDVKQQHSTGPWANPSRETSRSGQAKQ